MAPKHAKATPLDNKTFTMAKTSDNQRFINLLLHQILSAFPDIHGTTIGWNSSQLLLSGQVSRSFPDKEKNLWEKKQFE